MTRTEIPICPRCGEPTPRHRAGGIGRTRGASDHDYRCVDPDCGYAFDAYELEYREPKSALDPTNSDGADALIDADPDDILAGGGL